MCQRQAPHVAVWQGSDAQAKRNAAIIAAHIAAVEKGS